MMCGNDVRKSAVFLGVIYSPCSSTTCRSPSLKLLLFFWLRFFLLLLCRVFALADDGTHACNRAAVYLGLARIRVRN